MMAGDTLSNAIARDNSAQWPTVPTRTVAAQRQWEYRQRRKRSMIDAIGNETVASRATLLALLAHELATLDGHTAPANMLGPARNTARRVLAEIITRYAIEL
jgi:hypothetical protein